MPFTLDVKQEKIPKYIVTGECKLFLVLCFGRSLARWSFYMFSWYSCNKLKSTYFIVCHPFFSFLHVRIICAWILQTDMRTRASYVFASCILKAECISGARSIFANVLEGKRKWESEGRNRNVGNGATRRVALGTRLGHIWHFRIKATYFPNPWFFQI